MSSVNPPALPPLSSPSVLELLTTHRCSCARPWVVTGPRHHHQARCLITGCVQEVSAPTFPKPSLTISSPATPLLEIMISGKLSIQGSEPSAVLQLCSKHTRAAFHFLEDRHCLMRQANTPFGCKDSRSLSGTVFPPSLSSLLSCFPLKLCIQCHSSNPGAWCPVGTA